MTSDIIVARPVPAGSLRVLETAVYRGPHLYSRTPMVRIQIDLGRLEDFPTDRLPGFADKLATLLPGLGDHGCSYGVPGGFLKRLEEGTWLGHVCEHVALELQVQAGATVTRGKTRSVAGRPGVYDMMFAYEDAECGLLAGRYALQLVESLLPAELRGFSGLDLLPESPLAVFSLPAALADLKRLHAARTFGPTTLSLVREAEARGIPWRRLNADSLVEFGYGRFARRICASCSTLTSEIATEIASDKELTNRLLDEAGLPVPQALIVGSEEGAVRAAGKLGYPVVTKPLDGNHGRGVNVGLADAEEVRWGFAKAREHSADVLVEQHFEGSDHRILVIGGKLVAVARRVPAHVVGDGVSTLSALIEKENRNPKRGEGHEAPMTRIAIDECLLHFIARAGLTLETVPEKGAFVQLRPTANLSTGGSAIDLTDVIHPDNALIAIRAAAIVGLDIAGIDFVAPDITRSVRETGGGIIEVNAGPGFRMHLHPSEGTPRNVAGPVLDNLFPPGTPATIPIFAVTGTNGKTTTARMLAHIMAATGKKVGLTTSTGVYVNGQRIMEGDCTGPRSARLVLADPGVEVAVLETARGGLLREGLAFQRCDIGCVTNVSSDHLGLRGIETVEDLARVKAVIVEAVHEKGWSILNADNPLTAAMAAEAGGRICYFTTRARPDWPVFLKDHVRRGGRAIAGGRSTGTSDIVLYDGGAAFLVGRVEDIPATLQGLADFNVENALAASAMAICHGVSLPVIRSALATFGTSYEQSPGRLNIVDRNGYRTILDYAHNTHGLKALGQLVGKLKPSHSRIIGVVGMPGDRRDSDITEIGEVAAGMFDLVLIKEDGDLRGREPGSVATLLVDGLRRGGLNERAIRIIPDELQAVRQALDLAREGDLVVVMADDLDAIWHLVSTHERAAGTEGRSHHLAAE